MFDAKSLVAQFLGQQMPGTQGSVKDIAGKAMGKAKENPLATTAILGVLLGTDTGRDIGGSALKLGGMAAIAGLAYTAYQNYNSGQAPVKNPAQGQAQEALPAPEDSPFAPSAAPQGEAVFAVTLIRAMIAAARADGHIDDEERGRITERLQLTGIDGEAKQFIERELAAPMDMDGLVAAAQTDAQKVELYTASRIAIDPNTRAERGYLDLLAGRLQLPDSLIDHVEATIEAAYQS